MDEPGKPRAKGEWYFKTSAVVVAFLCVGPLALPMVWFNPRLSMAKKIVITLVSLVLTYFITITMITSVRHILEYYKELSGPL